MDDSTGFGILSYLEKASGGQGGFELSQQAFNIPVGGEAYLMEFSRCLVYLYEPEEVVYYQIVGSMRLTAQSWPDNRVLTIVSNNVITDVSEVKIGAYTVRLAIGTKSGLIDAVNTWASFVWAGQIESEKIQSIDEIYGFSFFKSVYRKQS